MKNVDHVEPAVPRPWPVFRGGTDDVEVTIRDVKVILTAPDGIRLVIVKVETSEPGLYGLGCATFTQRPFVVKTAVDDYLRPFLAGRDVHDIEDIWQAMYVSSYWRNGPVLNCAMSGVDMALWDIKGKIAGLPVYQLFGGKTREAADVYVHASGAEPEAVEDHARAFLEGGFRYIRCQVGVPGSSTYGVSKRTNDRYYAVSIATHQERWSPEAYVRRIPALFEHIRNTLGPDVELLHDIHERVPPLYAIRLAKELDPFRLFFLEDPFAPEDSGYFPMLRQHSVTPIAMGELYSNQAEYLPLIQDRLIDFIRVHISDIGGLTLARKLGALCEFYGVRAAWHGPADVSPVGHAANLALDLSSSNFGIQEAAFFSERAQEVFPGTPEIRAGAMWSNDRPGLGVDLDEELAANYPFPEHALNGAWPEIRRPDGGVQKP
ncbi:D-galactonate dehydratase family protein [soil metagenome]